jgi:hypothetical protein
MSGPFWIDKQALLLLHTKASRGMAGWKAFAMKACWIQRRPERRIRLPASPTPT